MSQSQPDQELEALLEFLRQNRGFDFTGYKRTTLERRVRHRMQTVGVERFSDYVDYLEVHPDEFGELFTTILINVTSFFRDSEAWAYVHEEILPRLLSAKRPDEPIRIWSAGCSSGEEAYTLAMVMAEAVGPASFRDRVKIYATDVDGEALDQARMGAYGPREIEAVPQELRETYFERVGDRYAVRKEYRRNVIFGRHDLVQDAPISRIDLLVCRNTLMYFNRETQSRILSRLAFALNDGGYLFLGKAEMLLTQADLFLPVELKRRFFTKSARPGPRDRLLAAGPREETVNHLVVHVRLREATFELDPVAQMAVDPSGTVVLANEQMRQLVRITLNDLGRPLQDLEVSFRPVELRSLIEQARTQRKAAGVREVRWNAGLGDTRWYDVEAIPLIDAADTYLGAKLLFQDMTATKQLREELELSKHELETAYEELQSTNEELQSTNEELETTNEELQSTNEELETTNEELQSTNEELETMNEELQSTNEELETTNTEMSGRSLELDRLNSFLASILSNLRIGVVVVDQQLAVQVWNPYLEALWGLRYDEVAGKNLMTLDIGLAVEELREPLRACLADAGPSQEIAVRATGRRGQAARCRITLAPLRSGRQGVDGGVIVLIEATPVRSRRATPPATVEPLGGTT